MGTPKSAEALLDDDPLMRLLWEDYSLCREQQMNIFYKKEMKGTKSVERLIIFPYTTGLAHLPGPGGLHDQDFLVMRMFNGFLEGERRGQLRKALTRG